MQKQYNCIRLCTLIVMALTTQYIVSAVDDITGDVGSAQTGSIVLSGGTSGLVFDSTTSTIETEFDFVALPLTTSTDGQITLGGDPTLHAYGTSNQNIFVGGFAGNFSTTAGNLTACGCGALSSVTSGSFNTALGHGALGNLTEGDSNTAVGDGAGSNLTEGGNNILVGKNAGSAYDGDESSNIIIGSNPGVAEETFTIRIGDGQAHQSCFIDGIYGATTDSETSLSVYVDDQGKLGTIVSSAQFKEKIKNMGNDSKPIFNLRPVSFVLKHDPKKVKQFGLIAEEVYKVFPELVVLDKHGNPYAIRYNELPVLMLNELQKQQDRIKTLESQVSDLEKRIQKLEAHN